MCYTFIGQPPLKADAPILDVSKLQALEELEFFASFSGGEYVFSIIFFFFSVFIWIVVKYISIGFILVQATG